MVETKKGGLTGRLLSTLLLPFAASDGSFISLSPLYWRAASCGSPSLILPSNPCLSLDLAETSADKLQAPERKQAAGNRVSLHSLPQST